MNLTQNDRLNQVTADTLVVGVDIGSQYLSAIWVANPQEQYIALKVIDELSRMGYKVATQIRPAETFYPAEDYHQDYLDQRQESPECHVYRPIFKGHG